jgi:hypothetical protein
MDGVAWKTLYGVYNGRWQSLCCTKMCDNDNGDNDNNDNNNNNNNNNI